MSIDSTDLRLKRLSERALRDGGRLDVAFLLEHAVPARRLRDLARRLGVSPKGFRIERAPAAALAKLLAERREPRDYEQVLGLVFAPAAAEPEEGRAGPPPTPDDHSAAQRLRDEELVRLRAELERARESVTRASEREAGLRQMAERHAEQLGMVRAELERVRLQLAGSSSTDAAGLQRDLSRRLHELELEIEARSSADEALRRQLAVERTRVRELEDENAELLLLVPKGRRRKTPPPPPPAPPRRFLLPYFLPSFYRSLVGKDRKSVERALQAVLLFCTEGHAYPGLEVKQLGGQDTWSLRASRGLRVYFRNREDGDLEFLELADREEQHTALRRLKER